MTVQFSVAVRNARVDAIEATIGVTPKLRLYTGAPPVNCAAVATGTLLATLTLPSDWENAASGGSVTKLGTWTGVGAAAGDIGYYRMLETTETTTHEQGTVTVTSGGGDLELDNISIAISQNITIDTWTKTDGNA